MNDTNYANKQGKPVVVVVKGWDWKGQSRAYHGEKKHSSRFGQGRMLCVCGTRCNESMREHTRTHTLTFVKTAIKLVSAQCSVSYRNMSPHLDGTSKV